MKIAYPASVVVFSMPKSVRILCHLSQLNHCLTVVLSLRKRALPRKLAHVFYIVIMNKHLFVCFLAVHVSNSCFRTLAVILVWDFSLSLSLKHKHKSSSQFYTQHNEEEEEDERKKERQKGRSKETEGNAAFSSHSHAQADTHTKRNAHAAGPPSSRLSHHAYPPQCCPFLVQALTQSQRPTIAVKRLPAPRAQKKEGKTTKEAKPQGPDLIEVIAVPLILGAAGKASVIGSTRGRLRLTTSRTNWPSGAPL